jgi:hypothetical protein
VHGAHARTPLLPRHTGLPGAAGTPHEGLAGANGTAIQRLTRGRRTGWRSTRPGWSWSRRPRARRRSLLLSEPLNEIRARRHCRPGNWLAGKWRSLSGRPWSDRRSRCQGRARRCRPRRDRRARNRTGLRTTTTRSNHMGRHLWKSRCGGRLRSAGRCGGRPKWGGWLGIRQWGRRCGRLWWPGNHCGRRLWQTRRFSGKRLPRARCIC